MLNCPFVENIQPSFCTLGSVLVLVFASQVGRLLFWQRRKSLICGDIAEKVMENGKKWQISGAKLRHLSTANVNGGNSADATLCCHCFVLMG